MQADCDHRFSFIYATLDVPGGTNDIAAYRITKWSQVVEKFPLGTLLLVTMHMFALRSRKIHSQMLKQIMLGRIHLTFV